MKWTNAVCAVSALGLMSACGVGSVSGEIDGKSVPSFSTAAFGGLEDIAGTETFFLLGYAMRGADACVDGAEFTSLNAERFEAIGDNNVDDLDAASEDTADFINDAFPVDSWYAALSFTGNDLDDVRDERVDAEEDDRTEPRFSLNFCLQEGKAEVSSNDGQPELDDGADCFIIGEGDLTFLLDDDDEKLRVYSESEVEAQFDDGDKAGDVTVDITFTGCGEIADSTEDLFKAVSALPPSAFE